jgi:hypothetical protein
VGFRRDSGRTSEEEPSERHAELVSEDRDAAENDLGWPVRRLN